MSDNLSNFLVDLASDPDRMKAFVNDPAHVVSQASLSEDEKAAVLTRDGGEVRRALGLAPGDAIPEGVVILD